MGKKFKILSSILLLSITLQNISISANISNLNWNINSVLSEKVGDGLTYTKINAQDKLSNLQNAYIFEYTPSENTLPLVSYGEKIIGMNRLGSLVDEMVMQNKVVLGALNGDFYSMQTGVPLGIMIDDGALISSDNNEYAIGFKPDGSAIIGLPSVEIFFENITKDDTPIKINHFNKQPTAWGAYILTEEFSADTRSSSPSLEIVIELNEKISPSGSVKGTVTKIASNTTKTEIQAGFAVISVCETAQEAANWKNVSVGDSILISTKCEDGWEDVISAIGGGDLILKDGVMPDGIIDDGHETQKNPRTSVGIRENGQVVFFAVDGRSSDSKGLTETDLSEVMAALGCTTALNLDGGGSTTVMVKRNYATKCEYVNVSTESNYRSIANGILFVSKFESDGIPSVLIEDEPLPYLLIGSTVPLTAKALDKAYMPTDVYLTAENLTASLPEGTDINIGSTNGGYFTAGSQKGEFIVNLTSEYNGNFLSGSTKVRVTDTIDDFFVSPEYIKIVPGASVKLNIYAEKNGEAVLCDAASFNFTLNDEQIVPNPEEYPDAIVICDFGYLDKNGYFNAFEDVEGYVEICISFGEIKQYATIKVSSKADLISDFESFEQVDLFSLSGTSPLRMAMGMGYKSFGSIGVAAIDDNAEISAYDFEILLSYPAPISEYAKSIKVWATGYINGDIYVQISDSSGNIHKIPYEITKDYRRHLGWCELTAYIPEELKNEGISLYSIIKADGDNLELVGSNELYIDNITIDYGRPETPLIDGLGDHWAAESILELYDIGVLQESDCENVDGKLYYAPDVKLTRGEFAKIITSWLLLDTSGHTGKEIELGDEAPKGLVPYIKSAIKNGIMSGRGTTESGAVIFDSSGTISRQEAFKVLGSLLPEAEGKAEFSDSYLISDWAIEGISRCIGAGIIKGYTDNTIRPYDKISRGEIAALLSRI